MGWNVPNPTRKVISQTSMPRARSRSRIAGVKCKLAVGAATALAVWGVQLWGQRQQRRRLLEGLPYPAMLFRNGHLRAQNAPAADWRANLDVLALARDSWRRGQDILRTIPAVEGQGFQARAIALPRGETLLLLEDLAAAQRQQAFYRNFIQNVSHELKTPLAVLRPISRRFSRGPWRIASTAAGSWSKLPTRPTVFTP